MTTFFSSTQLTAQITAADILAPVQAQLTVFLPGAAGGLSAALSFPIAGNYPLPVIASVSPATLFACSSTDVIITGNGFVGPPPGSSYYYGPTTTLNIGTSQYSYYSVTVIDSTKIKLPSLSLSPGTYSISVSNPTPGGGLSNSVVLTVNNPSPVIFSISPKVATAGGAAFTLNLVPSGCSAPSGAVVRWSGMDRTTTASNIYSYNYPYGYIYTLSASIPASDLVNAGTAQVTLSYPPPGGGESPPMTFFINPVTAPAPGISTIFPAVAAAGASGLTVTVNGSGFTSSSVVMWNGNARTTTQVSATQLKAAITAADLVAPATAQVSVFTPTPGGGTSTSLPFSIVASLTPAGSVLAGFVAALPGGQVRVPLSLNLNPGTTVDNVAFGVTITPSGSGANLTGSLAFEKDAAMPAPSQLDTTAAPNALSLFWNNLASPLSGTVQLGNVVVNIPALGASGHTYLLQITGADASLGSSHIFLNVSSSSISVSADYGVSDVFPVTNDSAGNFGDSAVNTVDLIATLRAVTNIPGFAPLACSDRFDALDSYPVDTPTKVGGDGFLNTLDLIQTLKRVTNLDTSRPRRLPRNIPCSSAEPMLHRPSARPDLRVEVGEPESPNRFPLYLVATRKLEIGGLSFSVLGEHLRFQPAAGSEPDLSDDQIPGTLALAWLKAVPLDAGQRVLLGYFENDAMPQVEGVSAHNAAGETIAIGWKSTRPAVR